LNPKFANELAVQIGRTFGFGALAESGKRGRAATEHGGNPGILLPSASSLIRAWGLQIMTAVRRTQLIRFAVWVGFATVAVLAAVISARTETGVRRIATLISNVPSTAARGAKDPQFASRQFDQEAEQWRISEAIRSLAADRDRLLARLNTLERGLDDVTGSIGPAKGPIPTAPALAPPTAAAPNTSAAPTASGAPATAAPAATSQSRVAAGHLATGMPSPTESVASKTEFGIDLGGNATVEGIRAIWASLRAGQPGLLEGLRPVVSIREVKPGSIELRLIAGPLANASVAARLCAALAASGQTCQPAVFDGQRLALQ
jgi:hypothetical protein